MNNTMTHENRTRTTAATWTSMAVALLSLAALAGCVDVTGDRGNQAPKASLTAEDRSGFVGQTFVFNGSGSSDPDGSIATWRFNFGDNTTREVNSSQDAKVEHQYAKGGEYVVTLTVLDDGADREGALSDSTSLAVAVNERHNVTAQVFQAAPPNGTVAAEYSQGFDAGPGADAAALNLSVQSVLPAGDSEILVRILDPAGQVLAEETVTVSAGQAETVSLQADLEEQGEHTLHIQAESGAASATGELVVLYDEGF